MNEQKRNILVAVFVIIALIGVGWLIKKFGDLPALVSRYDAHEITVLFPEAPGIEKNTEVLFRGYRVGQVVKVLPPAFLPDPCQPQQKAYQVPVNLAIDQEFDIPINAKPRIYQRSLGGGFIVLEVYETPEEQFLRDGDQIKGYLSQAGTFIPEPLQKKLDKLMDSLDNVTGLISQQLQQRSPQQVDQTTELSANVTTVVMRLDSTLKNLQAFTGDPQNQQNFKKGLADFAALSEEMRHAVKETQKVAQQAGELVGKMSNAIENIETVAVSANASFDQFSRDIQKSSEQFTRTLAMIQDIMKKIDNNQGTVGRLVNDPRLYDSLADTSENLDQAISDLRKMLEALKQKGLKLTL